MILAILSTRAGAAGLAVLAIVALLGGLYLLGRSEGRSSAALDAVRSQERIRTDAEAAARAAERDGALERMRGGRF